MVKDAKLASFYYFVLAVLKSADGWEDDGVTGVTDRTGVMKQAV